MRATTPTTIHDPVFRNAWRQRIQVGDRVIWADPDDGSGSGGYLVTQAPTSLEDGNLFSLRNAAGTEIDAWRAELFPPPEACRINDTDVWVQGNTIHGWDETRAAPHSEMRCRIMVPDERIAPVMALAGPARHALQELATLLDATLAASPLAANAAFYIAQAKAAVNAAGPGVLPDTSRWVARARFIYDRATGKEIAQAFGRYDYSNSWLMAGAPELLDALASVTEFAHAALAGGAQDEAWRLVDAYARAVLEQVPAEPARATEPIAEPAGA